MLEAVGERYWPVYFDTLRERLRAGRHRPCCRSSPSTTSASTRYRRGADFIQRYIFPGGMLPSPGALRAQAAARRPRRCSSAESLRRRATRATLVEWRRRFLRRWPEIAAARLRRPRSGGCGSTTSATARPASAAGRVDVGLYTLEHSASAIGHADCCARAFATSHRPVMLPHPSVASVVPSPLPLPARPCSSQPSPSRRRWRRARAGAPGAAAAARHAARPGLDRVRQQGRRRPRQDRRADRRSAAPARRQGRASLPPADVYRMDDTPAKTGAMVQAEWQGHRHEEDPADRPHGHRLPARHAARTSRSASTATAPTASASPTTSRASR